MNNMSQLPVPLERVSCTEGKRYLSASEVYLHQLTQHNEHFMIFCNIDTIVSTVELSKQLVRKSLSALSDRHQLLQSRITQDGDGNFVFEPLELSSDEEHEWILVKDISVDNVHDWSSTVQNEIMNGFDAGDVLWRVVLLRPHRRENLSYTYTLIFICQHCILDGLGAFDLIANQLVPIMNCLVEEKSLENLPRPTTMLNSFMDVFFDMVGPITSQSNFFTRMVVGVLFWTQRMFGVDTSQRMPDICVHEEYKKDGGRNFYPFHFDKELSSSITHFSKENSISVHSIFLLLMTSALEEAGKSFPSCKNNVRYLMYSTDMRKFNKHLSTYPFSCGAYVDLEYQRVNAVEIGDMASFLTAARNINSDVKGRIQPPNYIKRLTYMAMVSLVTNEELSIQERLISAVDLDKSVALSNIGNLDVKMHVDKSPSSQPVRLTEHNFTVCSPAPIFISTCMYNQHMRFCICYDTHWLNVDFIECFVKNFEEVCRNIMLGI